MHWFMAAPAQVGKRIAAWLWPPACAACAVRLPADSGVSVCAACYRALPWWRRDEVLAPDLKGITAFYAPFLYNGRVREMILSLKFHDGMHLVPLLSGWMADAAGAVPDDALLVPVPSHVSRLRWRGFSHTALLARAVAHKRRLPVSLDALKRVTASDGQIAKTRAQRLKLRGVDFWADARLVAGRHVVLVDDIVTTGGTVMACAIALRRVGAASVTVWTVAYTPEGFGAR